MDPAPIDLDELQALVRAVAMDETLRMQRGEPGAGWCIRAAEGVVLADPLDLDGRGADFTRGLAVHEAAHACITRYPYLLRERDVQSPGMRSLLNALEDCRIETWMLARFPGVRAWMQHYNDTLFPELAPLVAEAPLFQQFCLGAISTWWRGSPVPGTHPLVLDALRRTDDVRRSLMQLIPPQVHHVDVREVLAYSTSPAQSVFRPLEGMRPPDAFERQVRLCAFRAVRLIWREIRPVYLELLHRDEANGHDVRAAERGLLKTVREVRMVGLAPGRGVGQPLNDTVYDDIVDEVSGEARDRLDRVVRAAPADDYERARREVAPLVQRLVNELDRVLRPASYPRWNGGFVTGSRAELRRAMQLEADPRTVRSLWQRKTIPRSFDPAFLLLLDLSGSMSGERIATGFRGTVLLAEVLAQLGVPFAVHGFQDVLLPFKEVRAPLDAAVRERIGQMPREVEGCRLGGHNQPEHNWDGPVLLHAARHLLESGARDTFLIVVSDGEPSGPADASDALHAAVTTVRSMGVHLVGVGLGPGTDHVRRYYPHHLAETPLAAFPTALGRCLGALLMAGA